MFNTKQKKLVLSVVNSSFDHPTAQMVYDKCRTFMPNISLGTVYRNLNSLVDSKEIRRIHTIDNIDRFDKLETVHDHFICTSCNQIYDIPPITLPKLEGKKVLDYELTIRGICEKCQKERK